MVKVLVVEDDPLLRASCCDLLDMSGVSVSGVSCASEAVAFLESCAAEIAAVITDVMMPGDMDGVGLAVVVRQRWPHVRILVTSGGAANNRADFPDGVAFVPKPWGARDILGLIA